MDLVNQIVDERRRIEAEDEAKRLADLAARKERLKEQQQQQQEQKQKRGQSSSSQKMNESAKDSSSLKRATVAGGAKMMPPQRPTQQQANSKNNPRSGSASVHAADKKAADAKQQQTLRQTRREARKDEDAAAVVASSVAMLDSIVPAQLVDSAATFVLAEAPRIFSFHTRHISSFRHPFFTMLCHEIPGELGGVGGTGVGGGGGGGTADPEFGTMAQEQQADASGRRAGGKGAGAAGVNRTTLHRGGTAMVTTAHSAAVEHALKARRRPWQTIGEYLVERFSDISSGYPIEVERWRQASYMLDSVLLEEDLSRRRRDILEAAVVVRALEACWTSWGGTTTTGIDADSYREQHTRLYRTLLGAEKFDPVLGVQVDKCIDKDWIVDREIVGPRSSSPSRLSGQSPTRRRSVSPSGATGGAAGDDNSRRGSGVLVRQASTRSLSKAREGSQNGSDDLGSSKADAVSSNPQQQQQVVPLMVYEVPFRRFCVSMLELADNWTRARVGDVFSQVFAKFMMKVVWCPPRKEGRPLAVGAGSAVPASFAHNQQLDRERANQQKRFEEQIRLQDTTGNKKNGVIVGAVMKDPDGGGTRPSSATGSGGAAVVGAASAASNKQSKTEEWAAICAGLRRKAFLHRGGPIVRQVPPECPGVPASYVALPNTNDHFTGSSERTCVRT